MRLIILLLTFSLAVLGCERTNSRPHRELDEHEIRVGDVLLRADLVQPANTAAMSRQDTNPYIYFRVAISKAGSEKSDIERALYVNFDIQKDFQLHLGHDVKLPLICQRIQKGSGDEYEYLLAFDAANIPLQQCQLIYKDHLFGAGTVAFQYTAKDFKKNI